MFVLVINSTICMLYAPEIHAASCHGYVPSLPFLSNEDVYNGWHAVDFASQFCLNEPTETSQQ